MDPNQNNQPNPNFPSSQPVNAPFETTPTVQTVVEPDQPPVSPEQPVASGISTLLPTPESQAASVEPIVNIPAPASISEQPLAPPIQPPAPAYEQPASQMPEAPKAKSKLFLVIIIILIIGGLVFLGIQFTKNKGKSVTPSPYPVETPNLSTSTPVPDITATWKSYSNDIYKFTFKFPETWKIYTGGKFFKKGDLITVGIPETPLASGEKEVVRSFTVSVPVATSDTLEKYLETEKFLSENAYGQTPEVDKEEILSNETAYKIRTCGQNCLTYFFAKHNNLIYGAVYPSDETLSSDLKLFFDKIISTFTFTDRLGSPSASPTLTPSAKPTPAPSGSPFE